jgi:hypothetical protein
LLLFRHPSWAAPREKNITTEPLVRSAGRGSHNGKRRGNFALLPIKSRVTTGCRQLPGIPRFLCDLPPYFRGTAVEKRRASGGGSDALGKVGKDRRNFSASGDLDLPRFGLFALVEGDG